MQGHLRVVWKVRDRDNGLGGVERDVVVVSERVSEGKTLASCGCGSGL